MSDSIRLPDEPANVIEATAQAMQQTLEQARGDARVPAALLADMRSAWEMGMTYAR